MNKRLILIVLIALLLLSGCSPARSTAPQPSEARGAPAAMPQEPASNSAGGVSGGSADFSSDKVAPAAPAQPQAGPDQQTSANAQRLVIRTANLTIVVDDPAQALSAVGRMADSMQGYIVTSNLYKTNGSQGKQYPEANITIRVPAAKLNDAMDQIKKLVKNPGKDVTSETVSGQDVTKEYTDLSSRLTNLQNAEAQLREIMASATKTEDVLSVYNQLTQIREQIEVIKGQIKYYEESAAMSSISVLIQAQAAVQPLEIGGWQPVGVARNAVQALIDALQVIGTIVIWLGLFALPIGLLIFLPLRLIWWLVRRNRRPKMQAPPPTAAA